MADEYTSRMLEATSRHKKILDDGEALLKEERIKIAVEDYYDIGVLLNPDARIRATEVYKTYLNHLSVVRSFYIEFHRKFLEEVVETSYLLASYERERLLQRKTIDLEENNRIRIRINEIATINTKRLQRVIEIFDLNEVADVAVDGSILLHSDQDVEEFEGIMKDMELLDVEGLELVKLQKKKSIAGHAFISRLFSYFKSR